jgi:hypothetical protein
MLNNKFGDDYAEALKEALKMKRSGVIPAPIDDELGHLLYSVSQWGIAEEVKRGRLWRTLSQDVDFQSDILCAVVVSSGKVNLDRNPKEILVYLKQSVKNAIGMKIRYMNRHKRKHEDVTLDGVVETSDFYGNRSGVAYNLDLELGDHNVSSI